MSETPNVMTEEQLANLSDEELLNMAIIPEIQESQAPVEDEPEVEETQVEDDQDDEAYAARQEDDAADEETVATKEADEVSEDSGSETAQETKTAKTQETVSEEPDYKSLYEKIMGPFKANGKEIKLQSPEEAVQLMQMGANYTKKLQALQPNLRMLKMLENNGLLDEQKLSFLIDLDRRNPEAVKKLLKDSGLDPLDIDTSADTNYKPGNYRVSDDEMRFTSTLEEVASIPAGKEIIHTINKNWDAKSKEVLWSDPEILRVLTEQKEQGIYDRITTEVERLKMLGTISPTTPFIEAYHAVGNVMGQRGEFGTAQAATPRQQQPSQPSRVVDTRPAPRKTVTNNDRAKAASPTRSMPTKVAQDFNPLAMSDEDFEKNAELARRL
jgi:hypothetical protein